MGATRLTAMTTRWFTRGRAGWAPPRPSPEARPCGDRLVPANRRLGLIRCGGYTLRGGYDVQDGKHGHGATDAACGHTGMV